MPLHRHPALAPFSRDHHRGLQLAAALRADGSQHLRRGLPGAPRALAAHVQRVFAEELEPHFEAEELNVMAVVDGLDRDVDALCADLRREHDVMRAQMRELAAARDDATTLAILDRFARLFEAHVRTEERTLFTRVQELVDARTLAQIALRLER